MTKQNKTERWEKCECSCHKTLHYHCYKCDPIVNNHKLTIDIKPYEFPPTVLTENTVGRDIVVFHSIYEGGDWMIFLPEDWNIVDCGKKRLLIKTKI